MENNRKMKNYAIKEFIKLFKNYNNIFKISSKIESKKTLKENIQSIDNETYKPCSAGQYEFTEKIIYLIKNKPEDPSIKIKDLKTDHILKRTLMHEILHALLMKKIETEKGTKKYTQATFEYYKKDEIEAEIGRGMLEGLIEWILSKAYNEKTQIIDINSIDIKSTSNYYPIEENIVKQLEILYGEDKIMKICKNGKGELEKIFKNDFEKTISFLSNIDDINTFNNIISKLKSKKEKLKRSYEENESKQDILKKHWNKEINLNYLNIQEIFEIIDEDIDKKINENIIGNLRPTVYKVQQMINRILLEQLNEMETTTSNEKKQETLIKFNKIKNLLPKLGIMPGDQKSYSFYDEFADHFQALQETYKIEDVSEKSLIQKPKINIIDKIKEFILKQRKEIKNNEKSDLFKKDLNQIYIKSKNNIREKYFSKIQNVVAMEQIKKEENINKDENQKLENAEEKEL